MAGLYTDTTHGNIVIQDVSHALDKDTRTLFAGDNRKNQAQKKGDLPELHLLYYYGDITGPKELYLRNKCLHLITNKLQNNHAEHKENTERLRYQSMFEICGVDIMHISHYSIEFILNITNTPLLDEYTDEHKSDDTSSNTYSNKYLVATYQQSGYGGAVDDFVTIGLTSNMSYTDNLTLSNFYFDDFIQDLYKILKHLSWYDTSCELPTILFYTIAQYTMDCVHPVTYTRSDDDEVILNEGKLHLFLTGCLSPHNTDIKHDMNKLHCIGDILCELGQIVYKQYNSHKNAKKLKTEYDKWKKGFKKRTKCKPSNMRDLTLQLKLHQKQRDHAQSRQSINDLKYLYYKNPNFALKLKTKTKNKRNIIHGQAHTAHPSAMQSFKKMILSFGSSSKIKQYPYSATAPQLHHRRSQSVGVDMIHRAITEPHGKNKKKKKKKQKKQKKKRSAYHEWSVDDTYNYNNDDYGTQYMTTSSQFISNSSTAAVGYTAHASVPVCRVKEPAVILRSKSTGMKKRNKAVFNIKQNKSNKYTHPRTNDERQCMSMELLISSNYNVMDVDDDALPEAILEETQSEEIASRKRPVSSRLLATMIKPSKARSYDGMSTGSTGSNGDVYAHDDNKVCVLESYDKSNKIDTTRRESVTTIRAKDRIRSAFKEYERTKGKAPEDVDDFLQYCRRKNVKNVKRTLCEDILKEMRKIQSNQFVDGGDTILE